MTHRVRLQLIRASWLFVQWSGKLTEKIWEEKLFFWKFCAILNKDVCMLTNECENDKVDFVFASKYLFPASSRWILDAAVPHDLYLFPARYLFPASCDEYRMPGFKPAMQGCLCPASTTFPYLVDLPIFSRQVQAVMNTARCRCPARSLSFRGKRYLFRQVVVNTACRRGFK